MTTRADQAEAATTHESEPEDGKPRVAAASSNSRRSTTASIPARSTTGESSSQRRTTARAKSTGTPPARSGSGTSRAAANKSTASRAATRGTGRTAATPARPAPSSTARSARGTTAAKSAPAKSAPAKATPAKATPAKAAATKATQTKTTPTKTQTKATPTKTTATKATPSKTTATKATPTRSRPTPSKTAAIKTTPSRTTATKAAPNKATATKATPPKTAATTTTPSKTTATKATPAKTAKTTPSKAATKPTAATKTAASKPAPAKPTPAKSTTTKPAPKAEVVPAVPEAAPPAGVPTEKPHPIGPVAEVAAAPPELRADTAELPRISDERRGGIVTPTLRPSIEEPAVLRPLSEETPVPEPDPVPGFGFAPPGAPVILPPAEPGPEPKGTRYGREPLTPAARKALQRRRLVALIAFVLLAVIVLLIGQFVRGDDGRKVAGRPAATGEPAVNAGIGEPEVTTPGATKAQTTTAGATKTTAQEQEEAQVPADTANTAPTRAASATGFTFVAGYGPVLGTSGTLRRFKVSVEKTIGQGNGGDFADEIDRTLGDERGWTAGRQFRLQRVPAGAASEFTVYLASSKTTQRMCNAGGLKTDGFTSCRLPGQVIVNDARWQDAVPDYDAPLETYRAYALNHEVGHQLGYGHEACPGPGRAAPVMQQQTYGLKGCVANAWPYIDGKRYAGPPTT
ncbi:DUF3152 domain-containing protein [Actinoplanes sp. NPDC049265]|uniref:DUF3152 domain-containing protein n=1 Tax=Actinoplanes sp. NPDC049265 TaxID=3363902 RepID=UPI003716B67E